MMSLRGKREKGEEERERVYDEKILSYIPMYGARYIL